MPRLPLAPLYILFTLRVPEPTQVAPLTPRVVCTASSPLGTISGMLLMIRASPQVRISLLSTVHSPPSFRRVSSLSLTPWRCGQGRELVRGWMRAGSEAIHLSHQSDFHEVKGLNMAARPFETRPPSAQLKVNFLHPAKLPGDDRMFRDYSDVCRAVIIPPRGIGVGQSAENRCVREKTAYVASPSSAHLRGKKGT
jgi:hypothetical protein